GYGTSSRRNGPHQSGFQSPSYRDCELRARAGLVRQFEQQGRERIKASYFRYQFAVVSFLLRAALDEWCRDSVLPSGPQCRSRDFRGPMDDIPCSLLLSKLATSIRERQWFVIPPAAGARLRRSTGLRFQSR